MNDRENCHDQTNQFFPPGQVYGERADLFSSIICIRKFS